MKNLFLVTTFLCLTILGFSQVDQELAVSGSIITPAPACVGETVEMCFNFSASNGATLEGSQTIRFNLSSQFITDASLAATTPVSPSFITWVFDPFVNSWIGTIDTSLPQLTTGIICFPDLIVAEEVSQAQADALQGVGFRVNLTPHPGDVDEEDNFDENYTFTKPIVTPITLGVFTASAEGNDAVLNWTTLSESNNSHFEIERSLNGSEFITIDTVDSQVEDGNSEEELIYSHTDKEIGFRTSIAFYRIKQFDFNGEFSFSPIRVVTFDESIEFNESKLFPNPVNTGSPVNIVGPDITSVRVFTTVGELVELVEENSVPSTSIDTSNLATGYYIALINDKEVLKFVVQ